MTDLIQDFEAQFQRSVRWNNRHEKEIAAVAKTIADVLNDSMSGVLAFEVNPLYFRDNEFQLDCTKFGTGSHASIRGKLGSNNHVNFFDMDGKWQGVAEKDNLDSLQSTVVGFFARKFGELEKDMYQGVIFKEELFL